MQIDAAMWSSITPRHEDDALLQQPRGQVVAALAPVRLLDDDGPERVGDGRDMGLTCLPLTQRCAALKPKDRVESPRVQARSFFATSILLAMTVIVSMAVVMPVIVMVMVMIMAVIVVMMVVVMAVIMIVVVRDHGGDVSCPWACAGSSAVLVASIGLQQLLHRHLLLGRLGLLEDVVDHLVLEDRRPQLDQRRRVLLVVLVDEALLARIAPRLLDQRRA